MFFFFTFGCLLLKILRNDAFFFTFYSINITISLSYPFGRNSNKIMYHLYDCQIIRLQNDVRGFERSTQEIRLNQNTNDEKISQVYRTIKHRFRPSSSSCGSVFAGPARASRENTTTSEAVEILLGTLPHSPIRNELDVMCGSGKRKRISHDFAIQQSKIIYFRSH